MDLNRSSRKSGQIEVITYSHLGFTVLTIVVTTDRNGRIVNFNATVTDQDTCRISEGYLSILVRNAIRPVKVPSDDFDSLLDF